MHYIIAYGGILFDGLIVPLLLYRPTRKYAFAVAVFFHLFNSVVFQIGIFPYLALAFTLFFFEPKAIQKLFLKKKAFYEGSEIVFPKYKNAWLMVFSIYFIIQIGLPLRHHFFKDDVLWTEEGHRLSWRMMLRTKGAQVAYWVEDKQTGKREYVHLSEYITPKQKRAASTKPDVIWQFSQRLKNKYKVEGKDVAVYVNSKVSVNGKSFKTLINPDVDLASVEWQHFKHSDWILPSKTAVIEKSLFSSL